MRENERKKLREKYLEAFLNPKKPYLYVFMGSIVVDFTGNNEGCYILVSGDRGKHHRTHSKEDIGVIRHYEPCYCSEELYIC